MAAAAVDSVAEDRLSGTGDSCRAISGADAASAAILIDIDCGDIAAAAAVALIRPVSVDRFLHLLLRCLAHSQVTAAVAS